MTRGIVWPTLLTALVALGACNSTTEPVPLGFGNQRNFESHSEVDVGFASTSDGAVMAGTLYLPKTPGPHPAIVFHFGSNRWTRATYDASAIPTWVAQGIAVLSYDKRGVGKSQGTCCPWQQPGYFPLLAGDLVGAAQLLRQRADLDPQRIGLLGVSQGGWIVPVAATTAPDAVAFTIILSGPAVTLREELLYGFLTGEDQGCRPTGLTDEEIYQMMDAGLDPDPVPFQGSGFDPLPSIEQMKAPGLWIYGGRDTSVPVKRSIANLDRVRDELARDFTTIVFDNANHALIEGGAMCQEMGGPFVDALTPTFAWLASHQITGPMAAASADRLH